MRQFYHEKRDLIGKIDLGRKKPESAVFPALSSSSNRTGQGVFGYCRYLSIYRRIINDINLRIIKKEL